MGNVPSVGGGSCPSEGIFLRLRPREEGGGVGEDGIQGGGGNGVVGKVEES